MSDPTLPQIIDSVKKQLALQKFEELLVKINEKCFEKCVVKPGSSLSSSEQKCLSNCSSRYQDTWNLVSVAYTARLQRENVPM